MMQDVQEEHRLRGKGIVQPHPETHDHAVFLVCDDGLDGDA